MMSSDNGTHQEKELYFSALSVVIAVVSAAVGSSNTEPSFLYLNPFPFAAVPGFVAGSIAIARGERPRYMAAVGLALNSYGLLLLIGWLSLAFGDLHL